MTSIHSNGSEKAFKLLVGKFPRDFQKAFKGTETIESLLELASQQGCQKLMAGVAKGASTQGISLRKLSFERGVDLMGGVDVSCRVNGELIGFDITLDYSQVSKKEEKVLHGWNGQRQKLLKALGYSHVVIITWDVKSWVELTDQERGELAETLLIHIEDRPPNSFCSDLVLSM
ncbi:MAG: hypothetical protein ACKPFF_11745 [Planktothrix sp.]